MRTSANNAGLGGDNSALAASASVSSVTTTSAAARTLPAARKCNFRDTTSPTKASSQVRARCAETRKPPGTARRGDRDHLLSRRVSVRRGRAAGALRRPDEQRIGNIGIGADGPTGGRLQRQSWQSAWRRHRIGTGVRATVRTILAHVQQDRGSTLQWFAARIQRPALRADDAADVGAQHGDRRSNRHGPRKRRHESIDRNREECDPSEGWQGTSSAHRAHCNRVHGNVNDLPRYRARNGRRRCRSADGGAVVVGRAQGPSGALLAISRSSRPDARHAALLALHRLAVSIRGSGGKVTDARTPPVRGEQRYRAASRSRARCTHAGRGTARRGRFNWRRKRPGRHLDSVMGDHVQLAPAVGACGAKFECERRRLHPIRTVWIDGAEFGADGDPPAGSAQP